jgi:hypothetical protein
VCGSRKFTVGIDEMHPAARRAYALAFGQALQTVYVAAYKEAADLGDREGWRVFRHAVSQMFYAAGAGRSISSAGPSEAAGFGCTGKRNCNGDDTICLNT